MAKPSWSIRILPLVLFVGALEASAQTTIVVGPDACTLSPSTPPTLYPGDQFKWGIDPKTPAPKSLEIIFYQSGYPKGVTNDPLLSMLHSPNGGYSSVVAPTATQTVNPDVFINSTATQLTYKYWQVINGTPCDGRIIINKQNLKPPPKK